MGLKRSQDLPPGGAWPHTVHRTAHRLRNHEASRQGIGLLLLAVGAVVTEPAGEMRIACGLAIALGGQLWRIYAAGLISKNARLATAGAYSLVRHPLYLGNFIILSGFTLASARWWFVMGFVAFFLFYYPPAIRYEDAKLERLFGEPWRQWSAQTPAMIPVRWSWATDPGVHWNARQSLLRNGEAVISLFLSACAVLLLYRSGFFA